MGAARAGGGARGAGLAVRAETETEKSPLEYPQEWVVPPPTNKPDIFPDLKPWKVPLPKPMPGDPPQPDEGETQDDDDGIEPPPGEGEEGGENGEEGGGGGGEEREMPQA